MRNRTDHQLENKRALVTRGRRDIGAAIVKRLARDGALIALTYVSKPDQAKETAKAARAAARGDRVEERRRWLTLSK